MDAFKLNPRDAAAYNVTGFILDELGRSEEAQQAYEQAQRLIWASIKGLA
jgi:Flp pilus assembly protein TadD